MADRNRAAPESSRIEFRIGINLGDVIIEGEDIYGDGVNVAARLESIAEPGAISSSRALYAIRSAICGTIAHMAMQRSETAIAAGARAEVQALTV